LKAARFPYLEVPKKHSWSALRAREFLVTNNVPFEYRPSASRYELEYIARSRPQTIIFSNTHAVVLTSVNRL